MKNILIIGVLVFFIVLVFQNCKSKKGIVKINETDTRFELTKGVCFGRCPVFTLSISQNGIATFEGRINTDKQGIYKRKLTVEEMDGLEDAFGLSGFSKFDTEYKSKITDLPMIKIGYNNGKGLKLISGKETRPESLKQLQFMLERIADAGEWEMIKSAPDGSVNNTKKPKVLMIYDQVIIDPVPGLQMKRWLESKKSIGVRLIKKIAPGLNYYLITYNTELIKPEDFLKLLKDDKGIKTAEFNKKTSLRTR
ncbi:MAG: DUF6438 domain-containing protein [Saprospiraceae bacterium]